MPIDVLLMYVVEGDNRGDARALAGVVAEAVFDQGPSLWLRGDAS